MDSISVRAYQSYVMTFTDVFTLGLVHPYYPDGVCTDFAIEPTPRTGRLMANLRCVLKSGPGWVRVLNDSSLLAPDRNSLFVFRLRLQDPNFARFTDLSDYAATTAPVYSNETSTPSGPLSLTSRPARRGEASPDPDVRPAFDASEVPTGADFAEVEISIDVGREDSRRDVPRDFRIEFRPRLVLWAYYLVTDLKNKVGDFKIMERPADPDRPLSFASSAPRDLKAHPDPGDAVAARLAALHPGARCIRFVSDAPVPCRQSARRGVQLMLGTSPLVAPLPNPAPERFTILADPSDPSVPKEVLYHVVRHLTR